MESHGTLGTIWASLGMTAYYMALIWINILLGLFLGPLFMIPMTWLQDRKRAGGLFGGKDGALTVTVSAPFVFSFWELPTA